MKVTFISETGNLGGNHQSKQNEIKISFEFYTVFRSCSSNNVIIYSIYDIKIL